MAKVYKNDAGTVLQVDCGEDISGASAVALKVLKPNTSVEESWTGAAGGTGNQYVVVTIDGTTVKVDVAGEYRIQPHITALSGWTGRGETVRLVVHDHQQ